MVIIKQHIEKILRLERATVPQKDMVINESDIESKTVFCAHCTEPIFKTFSLRVSVDAYLISDSYNLFTARCDFPLRFKCFISKGETSSVQHLKHST